MSGRIAYYGNIVRNGLVLDLDAAKRDSYPGSGTSWRDIAGGVITGSLINGEKKNVCHLFKEKKLLSHNMQLKDCTN